MPQLLVRDVSIEAVEGLRKRAQRHGRSSEAELRSLLEREFVAKEDFWEKAARSREETKDLWFGNSTDILREERDNR